MKNDLFSIGPLTVHGYGLMIGIGVLAAYLTAEYRAKKNNLDHECIFWIVVWGLSGGLVGAKILYYITEIQDIIANPRLLLNVADGFVVYGGIIGGIVSAYFYLRWKKYRPIKYFDIAMPSIALAQGFGRIGCFLAGCCYGLETDSCIGITFRTSAYAPNNVPLIPTQLLSSGLNFLHFFILIFIAKRFKTDGLVLGMYLTLYSAGRFVIEFFRGDLIRGSVGRWSTSQFISIFIFIAGLAVIFWSVKRKKQSKEDV